ncbi:MAG TPA: MarR family transcriptional regulator [Thermoanaerobaculia bacterium]|nr:MarR family transcriptional regulator [Thermoanaerobaculia bacterium]
MPAPPSALAREIKQTRPFRSKRQEAALALLKTVDLLRQRTGEVFEPFGVTDQQYNVLRILRGAGAAGLPTLDIAGRMIEHAPGITRLVDRLEKKGLVVRKRCTTDRRQVFCVLAPAGAKLLARMDAPVRQMDGLLSALSESEASTLVRLLDALRAGLHRPSTSRRQA